MVWTCGKNGRSAFTLQDGKFLNEEVMWEF
jgi:hypothetical protein